MTAPAVAPENMPVPWWVTYLLWPCVKGWRRWRRFGLKLDWAIKLRILRWFTIEQSFVEVRSVTNGQRHDIDNTAKVAGMLNLSNTRLSCYVDELQHVLQADLIKYRKKHPYAETEKRLLAKASSPISAPGQPSARAQQAPAPADGAGDLDAVRGALADHGSGDDVASDVRPESANAGTEHEAVDEASAHDLCPHCHTPLVEGHLCPRPEEHI